MQLEEDTNVGIAVPYYTNRINVDNSTLQQIINEWNLTFRNQKSKDIPSIISGDELIDLFIKKKKLNENEYREKNKEFLKKTQELKGSYYGIKHGELIGSFKKEVKKIDPKDIELIIQWRDSSNKYIFFLNSKS